MLPILVHNKAAGCGRCHTFSRILAAAIARLTDVALFCCALTAASTAAGS
jgi:hypothetical protein